jgi:DNA (cytosine-5)-methyltransferase 1
LVPFTTEIESGSWPTPDAAVFNLTADPERHRERQARLKAAHGNGNGAGTPLAMAVRMPERWPTPTVTDSHGHGYTRDRGDPTKERLTLSGLARLWPTPTVDDANQGAGGRASGEFRSLTRSVIHGVAGSLWATPTAHPRTHSPRAVDHGEQLANQVGGSLNPTWVEWLMGFPLGWTDLGPSETRSSRRSSK